MALTEREYYTWDKQGELGHIGICRVTVIERDGEEVSKAYHRHVIDPDSDLTNEPDEIKAIARTYHTQAIKDGWKAHRAAQNESMN